MRRQPKLTLIGPLLIGLIFLVTFAVLARGISNLGNQMVTESLTSIGRAQASLASRSLFNPLHQLDVFEIDGLINQYVQETEITYVAVYDIDGALVTEVIDSRQPTATTSQNLIAQALTQQAVVQQEIDSFLLVAGPIALGSQQIGTITIGYDSSILESSFQPIFRLLNLILIVVFVLAVVTISVFMRWGTRQLGQLAAAAGELGAGNLQKKVEVSGFYELATVGEAMESMRQSLLSSYQDLEQRVAARTRALETSAEVSRRLSTLLDLEQLVSEVVNQIQSAFAYYHVHIYLVDEAKRDLVMGGGTGDAGLAMLAAGHRLQFDQGLVGRAATENTAVLIPDVSQDPNWLPHPLLPDTKAEAAVPIALGDIVLGVLDVQHDKINGLDEEDTRLLQSVANQIAIVLRNARLFEQAQRQADQEAVINQIGYQIRRSSDMDSILQIAARELGQALNVKQATIQISASQTPAPVPQEQIVSSTNGDSAHG